MGRPRSTRGRGIHSKPAGAAAPTPGPTPKAEPKGKKSRAATGPTADTTTVAPPPRIRCLKFPVTERDDELVRCSICSEEFKFRAWRLHNIEKHYNLGTTTDDSTLIDHKFYERKLKEMAKLMKITAFKCPRDPCTASYKSSLGLSYHLETCGKTEEEIAACLLECPECHQKFTLPNMAWHRKSHLPPKPPKPYVPREPVYKRKSAEKARGTIKEAILPDGIDEDGNPVPSRRSIQLDPDVLDDDYKGKTDGARVRKREPTYKKAIPKTKLIFTGAGAADEELPGGEAFIYQRSFPYILGTFDSHLKAQANSSSPKKVNFTTTFPGKPSMDISVQCVKYLETTAGINSTCLWEPKARVELDPFETLKLDSNPLIAPKNINEIRQFLPEMESSVSFRTKVQIPSMFRKKTNSKKSAAATKAKFSITDFHRLKRFSSEIIGVSGDNDPVGILGTLKDQNNWIFFTGGAVTSLAWHSNGKTLAISTLKNHTENPNLIPCPKPNEKQSCSIQIWSQEASEDSIGFKLEIIYGLEAFGNINHLQWGNYWPDEEQSGNLGYIAAAFEDSTCRILRVGATDCKLKENFKKSNSKVRLYKKTPEICLSIEDESLELGQCLIFDWHEQNRFLATGYSKGQVGVFDLQTKSKFLKRTDTIMQVEKKPPISKPTTVAHFFPFWIITSHSGPIRGLIIDPKTPSYIYTASMDKTLRTWDVELRTEIECKRLGCIVDMVWMRGWVHLSVSFEAAMSNQSSHFSFLRFYQLGKTKGERNVMEYFNITSSSFFEGMLLTGLEQGRLITSYFDSYWRDSDYDRSKKKQNVLCLSSIELDEDSFEQIEEANRPEDIVSFPTDEEPRITILFTKLRTQSTVQQEPTAQYIENFYRFYKFLRINKVSWSPDGKYMAVGYRNGLVTILPGTFEKLYPEFY